MWGEDKRHPMRFQIIHQGVSKDPFPNPAHREMGIRYLTVRDQQSYQDTNRRDPCPVARCGWIEAECDLGLHQHVPRYPHDQAYVHFEVVEAVRSSDHSMS